jgi:DNA-binding transcriptional regulator YdaS (Cro superfamily)
MFIEFIKSSGQNRSAWADRLGVSRSYLSDLLNGNKRPSLDLAVQIERATGGAVPATSWIDDPATQTPTEDAA